MHEALSSIPSTKEEEGEWGGRGEEEAASRLLEGIERENKRHCYPLALSQPWISALQFLRMPITDS
jgi:hypothetical protein